MIRPPDSLHRAPLLWVATVTSFALALATPSFAQTESAFVIAPYVQHVSATDATLRFETKTASSATIDLSWSPSQTKTIRVANPAPFQSVPLDGLQPATVYHYKVRAGESATADGSFETAHTDSSRPFVFVAYGDSRSNAEVHTAIVRAITTLTPDFLLGTGDVVMAGDSAQDWKEFFAIERPLMRERCLFSAIGNHDLDRLPGGRSNYLRYLGKADGDQRRAYFSFRWGNARLFVLDAMDVWDGEQAAWLRAELAKADNEPGLNHRMVALHHSPYSSGHHGPNRAFVRANMPALLREHQVELVLAGHDHLYERGEVDGIKYIITGGAGAPLYPDASPQPGSERIAVVHHFVQLRVDGEQVTATTHALGGEVLERCSYRPGQRWMCDKTATRATSAAPGTSASSVTHASPVSSAPGARSRCGCATPGERSEPVTRVGFGALVLGLATSRRTKRRQTRKHVPSGATRHANVEPNTGAPSTPGSSSF